MRKLLFRAWNKEKKCFFMLNISMGFNGTSEVWEDVEQYTGLLDNNGKKMFFGDRVNMFDWGIGKNQLIGEAVIVWDEDELCVSSRPVHVEDRYDFCKKVVFEIIGNIHE